MAESDSPLAAPPDATDTDPFAHWITYLTCADLDLPTWTVAEIQSKLSQMNLDAVLGYLARLSKEAVDRSSAFYQHAYQRRLVWDALAEVEVMPPATKQRMLARWIANTQPTPLVHPHNLAWLSHIALLHCRRGTEVHTIPPSDLRLIARLLLAANDHISPMPTIKPTTSLRERRDVAVGILRQWQFSENYDVERAMRTFLRTKEVYVERLRLRYGIDEAFAVATGGISLDVYFAFYFAVLTYVFADQIASQLGAPKGTGMRGQWIDKAGFLDLVEDHREECARILGWWTSSPNEYIERLQSLQKILPGAMHQLDFTQLRATPLIELRPGGLVAPSISFLFQKIADEIYYRVLDSLQDEEAKGTFQSAVGKAFEDNAREVTEKIASACATQGWTSHPAASLHLGSSEVADAILSNGETAIVFELKALRLSTRFLIGSGDEHRVLGPNDDGLTVVAAGTATPDLLRKQDRGVLTKGANQQSRALNAIKTFSTRPSGTTFKKLFPAIIHLAPVQVDRLVWDIYLDPFFTAAHYYDAPAWSRPVWIGINGLEDLRDFVSQGSVDLLGLFEYVAEAPTYQPFDLALATFLGQDARRNTNWLGKALLQEARVSEKVLFPRSSAESETG